MSEDKYKKQAERLLRDVDNSSQEVKESVSTVTPVEEPRRYSQDTIIPVREAPEKIRDNSVEIPSKPSLEKRNRTYWGYTQGKGFKRKSKVNYYEY